MARLERDGDWQELVDRAVDVLLVTLANYPHDHIELAASQAKDRLGSVALRQQTFDESVLEREAGDVRAAVRTSALNLLAAARVGGSTRCDNGQSTVDCDFILRPHGTPYYRCVGTCAARLLRQRVQHHPMSVRA